MHARIWYLDFSLIVSFQYVIVRFYGTHSWVSLYGNGAIHYCYSIHSKSFFLNNVSQWSIKTYFVSTGTARDGRTRAEWMCPVLKTSHYVKSLNNWKKMFVEAWLSLFVDSLALDETWIIDINYGNKLSLKWFFNFGITFDVTTVISSLGHLN